MRLVDQGDEFLHALAGAFLDVVDAEGVVEVDIVGVDEVDFAVGIGVVDEARCGIDVEGGAYDDEDVGFVDCVGSGLDHWDTLAEPDDEGTELAAVLCLVAHLDFEVVFGEFDDAVGVVRILGGGRLHEFAVKVDDIGASGTLVEVVNVLSHNGYVVLALELSDELVTFVWLHGLELSATLVVEVYH